MTPEERLGEIVSALESAGICPLVMGGHAVRFYGLARNTNDFDLHIASDPWEDLAVRLARCPLFVDLGVTEGPSWRAHAFRRFRIGTLPGGGDEWLEFWRENHLLAPHTELLSRAQTGRYGTHEMAFLALPDLIRSKETERDKDWADVSRLEEFWDARLQSSMCRGETEPIAVLSQLRSRTGFGTHFLGKSFENRSFVTAAIESTRNPITQAYLIPFAPDAELSRHTVIPIENVI